MNASMRFGPHSHDFSFDSKCLLAYCFQKVESSTYSKLRSDVQPRPDRQAQTVWLTLHLNDRDLSAN